jgi:hypothetical protein
MPWPDKIEREPMTHARFRELYEQQWPEPDGENF